MIALILKLLIDSDPANIDLSLITNLQLLLKDNQLLSQFTLDPKIITLFKKLLFEKGTTLAGPLSALCVLLAENSYFDNYIDVRTFPQILIMLTSISENADAEVPALESMVGLLSKIS